MKNKQFISIAIGIFVTGIVVHFFPALVPLALVAQGLLLTWLVNRAEKKTEVDIQTVGKNLVDAGAALTDTLKVAFGNIKKVSMEVARQRKTISDTAKRTKLIERKLQKSKNRRDGAQDMASVEMADQTDKLEQYNQDDGN